MGKIEREVSGKKVGEQKTGYIDYTDIEECLHNGADAAASRALDRLEELHVILHPVQLLTRRTKTSNYSHSQLKSLKTGKASMLSS